MPNEMSLKGVLPIIPTPFDADGEVHYEDLERIAGHLLRGGCHAVTLFGIAGEYYKLSDGEMDEMARRVISVCRAHGKPSVLSVTRHATHLAEAQARRWQELGADNLMLLPPFFLKPDAGSLLHHMRRVVEAVDIPVMLQYAPEQTGVAIAPEQLAAVREAGDNARYFKVECRPPGAYISSLRGILGDRGDVFVGNAGFQMIEGYLRGAVGAMPGASLFDIYIRLHDLLTEERTEEAVALHEKLLAVLNHIRQNVEQIIHYEKRILDARGLLPYRGTRHPAFQSDRYYDAVFDLLLERIQPLWSYQG